MPPRLSGFKQPPFPIAHGFCRSRIWAGLSWEVLLFLMALTKVTQEYAFGSWAGVAVPRWPYHVSGTLAETTGKAWALLGQLTETSARGVFSMAVLGELDFLQGGWLYPQSKHPKRTIVTMS